MSAIDNLRVWWKKIPEGKIIAIAFGLFVTLAILKIIMAFIEEIAIKHP